MSKNGEPKVWRQRIERSKRVRKNYIEDKDFFLNLYINQATPNSTQRRRDVMQVNYIYSHIRLVSPSIFAGNPRINVKPRFVSMPGAEEAAQNLEGSIHYWAKELGAADEFQSALFDSFFGLAAVEVGWDYRTQIIEEAVPALDEMGNLTMQMQPVEKVLSDKPFLRWRDSKDILLDVDVPRRKDGRFQIVRDVVTHDYFQNMNEIPQELRDRVKPTVRPEDMAKNDMNVEYKDKDVASDSEWVELEWIWCKESGKRYLMTPSVQNEFLLVTDWPFELNFEGDSFPVTILDSINDNRYPYSWSEFRPAMEHIRELNRIRSNVQAHVKTGQPKYGFVKGALTRAQAAKWANAKPDELIEMQNPDGVKQMPIAEFSPELYKWNEQVESDLIKLTGLVEYESSPQADTATEASIIEGRSQVRKRDRSRKFERFVTANLTKLGQLCQQFQNVKVAVEINGPEGKTWRQVGREEIRGDFNFDMEPGVMEFKNEALRKQQLLKFTEIMAGNPHVDQRELAEELAKAFDFSEDKILKEESEMEAPKPEPMIKFKQIDVATLPDPRVQSMVVMAALEQNGALPQQAPPPEQDDIMEQQNMGSIADEGNASPMGGMMPLPPVEGNTNPQEGISG